MLCNKKISVLALLAGGLLLGVPGYVVGEHGAAKEAGKQAEGKAAAEEAKEGEKGEEAVAPKYTLSKPLDGFFDIQTLRKASRIYSYRYALKGIKLSVTNEDQWVVILNCAVEFGSESGMAEITERESAIRDDIQHITDGLDPRDLLSVAGKRRFKELIISAMNKRLTTARVRQLYWTDFQVGR